MGFGFCPYPSELDLVAVEDEQIRDAGADSDLVLDDEQAGLGGHGAVAGGERTVATGETPSKATSFAQSGL
jgi:hypothetical protein